MQVGGIVGTTLVTPDNVLTLAGNGKVFGDTVMNFSARPTRRQVYFDTNEAIVRTAQKRAGRHRRRRRS